MPFADLLTVQTQPSGVVHQLVLIVVQPAYIRGALARVEDHLGGKGEGGRGVGGGGGQSPTAELEWIRISTHVHISYTWKL